MLCAAVATTAAVLVRSETNDVCSTAGCVPACEAGVVLAGRACRCGRTARAPSGSRRPVAGATKHRGARGLSANRIPGSGRVQAVRSEVIRRQHCSQARRNDDDACQSAAERPPGSRTASGQPPPESLVQVHHRVPDPYVDDDSGKHRQDVNGYRCGNGRHGSRRDPLNGRFSGTCPLQTGLNQRRRRRWAVTGSNRRPPGCKPGALPAELTARGGER